MPMSSLFSMMVSLTQAQELMKIANTTKTLQTTLIKHKYNLKKLFYLSWKPANLAKVR